MKLEANKFYIISEYHVLLYSDIPRHLTDEPVRDLRGTAPKAVWAGSAARTSAVAAALRVAAVAMAATDEAAAAAARAAAASGAVAAEQAPTWAKSVLPGGASGSALVESSLTGIRQNIAITWFPAKQAFLVVTPAEEDFWAQVVVGDKIGYIVNRAWLEPKIWIPENGE